MTPITQVLSACALSGRDRHRDLAEQLERHLGRLVRRLSSPRC
jgi:hypothetical protein